MNFGESLKKARKAKSLSQKELGDMLGVGQTTVANYEKNLRFPNREILIKLTALLEISMGTLISDEKEIKVDAFTLEEIVDYKQKIETFLLEDEIDKANEFVMSLSLSLKRRVQLFEEIFKPILFHIGELWEAGKISIAKEHYLSALLYQLITSISMYELQDIPVYSGREKEKPVALCLTQSSEIHAIGLRMVSDYLKVMGFNSFYLGSGIPTESLLDMIYTKNPAIIALSITMEYNLDALKNMIEVIKSSILNENRKSKKNQYSVPIIIVGGQGVASKEIAVDMGADIYAQDFEQLKKAIVERDIR